MYKMQKSTSTISQTHNVILILKPAFKVYNKWALVCFIEVFIS